MSYMCIFNHLRINKFNLKLKLKTYINGRTSPVHFTMCWFTIECYRSILKFNYCLNYLAMKDELSSNDEGNRYPLWNYF